MKYILTLLALFLGTHPSVFAGEASKNTVRDKPNIVIIFTDDQGYGELTGFVGGPVVEECRAIVLNCSHLLTA